MNFSLFLFCTGHGRCKTGKGKIDMGGAVTQGAGRRDLALGYYRVAPPGRRTTIVRGFTSAGYPPALASLRSKCSGFLMMLGRCDRLGPQGLFGSAMANKTSVMNAIATAASVEEISAVRTLFQEYAAELGVDLCFQGFSRELETLPGAYAAPAGGLLMARVEGELAGCVAMRPLEKDVCEMKRLFVRPLFRGRGLARALVKEIIRAAQAAGYRAMVLDTLDWMRRAIKLYKSSDSSGGLPTMKTLCRA